MLWSKSRGSSTCQLDFGLSLLGQVRTPPLTTGSWGNRVVDRPQVALRPVEAQALRVRGLRLEMTEVSWGDLEKLQPKIRGSGVPKFVENRASCPTNSSESGCRMSQGDAMTCGSQPSRGSPQTLKSQRRFFDQASGSIVLCRKWTRVTTHQEDAHTWIMHGSATIVRCMEECSRLIAPSSQERVEN